MKSRKPFNEKYSWENIPKKKNVGYRFTKRVLDVVLGIIILLATSPLFLLGLLISLFSTRYYPIFADQRVGKKNRNIKVLKFRTMYKDAETNIRDYLNKKQIKQWKQERKVDNDPRVTKSGAFLRKTSIDELPQLLNIIIGTMSFVGPRPITRWELENNFTPEEQEILTNVRPGLTGMWQVYGRTEETWKSGRRKRLDQFYLKKRSLSLDIRLFILTIPSCIGFLFHRNKKEEVNK